MNRNLLLLASIALAGKAAAEVPKVAVDIAPVHSLVARVMDGTGEPTLIIPPGASPHDHAMRPSEARALQSADIVFWVGPELTPWMTKPLGALSPDAKQVELLETEGTLLHAFRDLADEHHDVHEEGDHADHDGHEEHADHDGHSDEHSDQDAQDHEEGADDHAHDHDGVDPHAWLDPTNARIWVQVIGETLARVDPENADLYQENAQAAVADLHALETEIKTNLAEAHALRFITFHDAYQYFEIPFGLSSAGTISLGDATAPGPARLAELKARISGDGIDCAFAEPQYDTRLINAAIEGANAKVLVLDPIGVTLEPGPSLYPDLLRAMAASFQSCSEGS